MEGRAWLGCAGPTPTRASDGVSRLINNVVIIIEVSIIIIIIVIVVVMMRRDAPRTP